MPIHFRCAHCSQLMAIARRKAGTVIHCPTCNGQVIVPKGVSQVEPSGELPLSEPAAAPLLERSDFDNILRPPAPGQAVAAYGAAATAASPPPFPDVPAAIPMAVPATRRSELEPIPIPAGRDQVRVLGSDWPSAAAPTGPGILISPAKATFLSVVVILLLAVAFVAGLLIGRFSRRGDSEAGLRTPVGNGLCAVPHATGGAGGRNATEGVPYRGLLAARVDLQTIEPAFQGRAVE